MENRVKFKIGEIEFEAEGTAEMIERERNVFLTTLFPAAVDAIVRTRCVAKGTQYIETPHSDSLMEDNNTLSEQNVINSAIDLTRTSLASFVKAKGADAHYDFILCAVYYNGKRNGISSFSSATLKDLYSEVKKPLPNNPSMSLSELVKKGFIMENPHAKGANPKEYILTLDGEEMVENMQPKEKKSQPKPRKTQLKEKSIYSDVNCDELNLVNYPEVKSLKTFKEKMITVLYIITNEGKGEWFSTSDVLCLMTDIFGESATKDQIEGVFKREKRWFKSENIDGNNKLVHRKLLNEAKSFAQSLSRSTD